MNPKWNGEIISSLRQELYELKGLENVPAMIIKIIDDELWKEFYDEVVEEVVHHKSFESFVTTDPPRGLGLTLKKLRKFIEDDVKALDKYDRAIQRKDGEHEGNQYTKRVGTHDNIMIPNQQGTSETYALRRLRAHRPDLHGQVLEGEKSAHAAMVEAGFRKRTFQAHMQPEAIARGILRHFEQDDIDAIIQILEDAK